MVDAGQRLKMRRCTISDEMETSAEIKGGKVRSSNRWSQTETVVYFPASAAPHGGQIEDLWRTLLSCLLSTQYHHPHAAADVHSYSTCPQRSITGVLSIKNGFTANS